MRSEFAKAETVQPDHVKNWNRACGIEHAIECAGIAGLYANDLHHQRDCPLGGYMLARAKGDRVNLDNMAKRRIVPALSRCAVCLQPESARHRGHSFERDETLPHWPSWYALRRFHGTQVREQAGNSDTMSKALGNSKAVADKHYLKPVEVLPDVRKAVNDAFRGLTGVQPLCN